MKKIIAILAILMLVPFTAFGLETLSEDVLNDVTGQAGVSIALDVQMDITMDTLAWGDSDGIDADATQTEGWVGLKDLNIQNLRIHLNPALVNPGAGSPDIRLFTIDVATDATRGTYVHMLLGSQMIEMESMTADVELGANHDLGRQLGNIAMYDFTMILNGDSYVDISAHGDALTGAGVTLDFDITVESIDIASIAWGDRDGAGADQILAPTGVVTDAPLQLTTTTGAGYIGLQNVAITNMTVTGQVLIDVATLNPAAIQGAGQAAGLVGVYMGMLATGGYDGGMTAVVIRLNNINFGIETFAADVVLSGNADLSNGSTMGSIWMDNLDVNVNGWVAIFAH